MYQNWQLLFGEIGALVLIAAAVGVLAGWIIWGRR